MENKCKIFKRGRKQTGITLVALVVTIVVLLILAGVSLNLVLSNNGIINKAGEAKDKYGEAKTNEQTDLDSAVDWMEDMTGPITVEPENIDDWEYKIEDDNTITITAYKGNATELIIPNSINGIRVKKIYGADGKNMSTSGNKISIWDDSICSTFVSIWSDHTGAQNITKKIKVSKGIEEIGDWAFTGTVELEEIEIPSSVRYIGAGAFLGCYKMKTNVNIPVEQNEIFEYTFAQCSSLTEIAIPENVTSIGGYAFQGCTGLTSITIPENVTSIGQYTFRSCIGLTSIAIPDNVTSIEYGAFSYCSGLTNITIPNNVTFIGSYAFQGCSGLTNITIPENVTSIGYGAFSYCSGLTNITIPENVTSIEGNAFCDCTGLTSITIPDNVTSIKYGAFRGCIGLTNITIPNSVTSIEQFAFSGCTGLTNITIPSSVNKMEYKVFAMIPSITVNVPFKEGETPKGWHSYWNSTDSGYNVTVNYAQ